MYVFSNLKIPTTQGKFERLDKLDIMKSTKLKYGIYNVAIKKNHPIVKISPDD